MITIISCLISFLLVSYWLILSKFSNAVLYAGFATLLIAAAKYFAYPSIFFDVVFGIFISVLLFLTIPVISLCCVVCCSIGKIFKQKAT
tara:strand:+ start:521 stop:787 length:267 start_codon:yes stop_codon:yes gene_type:complete